MTNEFGLPEKREDKIKLLKYLIKKCGFMKKLQLGRKYYRTDKMKDEVLDIAIVYVAKFVRMKELTKVKYPKALIPSKRRRRKC